MPLPCSRRPRRGIPLLTCALLLVAATGLLSAQTPSVRITRLTSPPDIDLVARGVEPDGMAKVTGFRQREPRDGEPASRETVAYLGFDDQQFHVVFVCKEDAGTVRARMAKRESISGDDTVGLVLDTFHDHRHAYLFLVNPLGIQMDGINTDGQDDDYSFDTLWTSEGRLTSDGYVVRISVPFRSLRFAKADVQQWGIALGRILPTRNETSFWPYVTRKIPSVQQQLAHLDGLERISPGRNLQFIPYGAFTGSRYLDEDALAYGQRREARVGLDAKMVLRDALTLDVAVNPDFSQVESDEPQVTINQRFEVQFPEKRPFFIENASYFTSREDLFFSRRIVDPQVGARLTGRVGGWTVGGLVMDDRAPGERAAADTPEHGRRAAIAVGRVVREFGRQSTVGVLVTSRDFAAGSSRVASVDTRLRLDDNWTVTGQAIASRNVGLDGSGSSGTEFLAGVSYGSRTVDFRVGYKDRSPRFRTDLGYVPRSDIRRLESEAGYKFFPKGRRLLSWGPAIEASILWDQAGQLQDWEVNPEVELELPGQTQLHMSAARSYERYEGIGFDKQRAGVYFTTEWLKWLSLMLSGGVGTSINYYPAAGLAPSLASAREVESGVTLRPSPRLRVEQTYIYNTLAPRGGDASKATIFRLHMLRTKANYQFTRELSVRAILDYNLLNPNRAFVALDRDRRLSADVLATYLLNPGTALHVGYADSRANLLLDPTLAPWARRTDSATTLTGRQFFVKVSYLLRY